MQQILQFGAKADGGGQVTHYARSYHATVKDTQAYPFRGTKDMGQTPYLQKVFLAMLGYFLGHLFMYFILKILLLLGIILLLL